MMKKSLRIAGAVLLIVLAVVLYAGEVYDRSIVTIGVTGAARWTNTAAYAAIQIKRISICSNGATTNNLTIRRISSDNVYTQLVVTATHPTPGTHTALSYDYMKYGDQLAISSSTGTNAVLMIEYLVQQH